MSYQLQKHILSASDSKNYQDALNEWILESDKMPNETGFCICGRKIKNIYYARNVRHKIQEIYFTLCSQDFPYFLITDTTDVFFTDCASRLLADFKEMNKSVVIGAEPEFFYRHGKYPQDVVKQYFSSICPPSQFHKFPNGGMLIGKRKKLTIIVRITLRRFIMISLVRMPHHSFPHHRGVY